MSADRDLRVARLALRLHVGEDGDPLDNDILDAFEALPESTIIRNDWIRRRLVIGHLLEREGISGLLAVIGGLSGTAAVPAADTSPSPTVDETDDLASAGFEPPEFNDGPAAEIGQRVSAPAPVEASSAKKKMFGLMPVIPVVEDPAVDTEPAEACASETDPGTVAEPNAGPFPDTGTVTADQEPEPVSEPEVAASMQADDADLNASTPEPAKPRIRIEPAQQPVIRIPTADQPELLGDSKPVATNPVDDTRAMLERFSRAGSEAADASQDAGFNPVLEPDFQS